jgi:hypothetical protein
MIWALFSDFTILALMCLKSLYRMPYRSLYGCAQSLFVLINRPLPIPHFTRICQRSKKLNLPKEPRGEKIRDIVTDGSGIKIYVAINPDTQEVLLTDVTHEILMDSQTLPRFLKRIRSRIRRVYGDGAYDTKKCYQLMLL